MKTWVLGDVHGGYKALLQVFERSNFDYEKDTLISLGDTADGWDEIKECFDELLKIKNLIYILGNHDTWLLDWFMFGAMPLLWLSQGGSNTLESYGCAHTDVPKEHIELLNYAPVYYLDGDNRIFVHGGFDIDKPIDVQRESDIMWDRDLIGYARQVSRLKDTGVPKRLQKYNEIFLGHTTTLCYGGMEPMHCCNVWNLDTGAGWGGKLTIMNVDTKEYFQSDKVSTLYPHLKGRG